METCKNRTGGQIGCLFYFRGAVARVPASDVYSVVIGYTVPAGCERQTVPVIFPAQGSDVPISVVLRNQELFSHWWFAHSYLLPFEAALPQN
ncbi:hypothetical protein EV199_1045 [Pseudobacter ginsenosidimutans]|uniref:Uncharacterized protein n=1 Tax=Pseudobacter ginsenosidimutans TaxID=661488 RepID=A0A4Q7N1F6_9BACT|nr:hypothetical protein EV199_1045 [Pseudobacter ginsenosidimutans]